MQTAGSIGLCHSFVGCRHKRKKQSKLGFAICLSLSLSPLGFQKKEERPRIDEATTARVATPSYGPGFESAVGHPCVDHSDRHAGDRGGFLDT